ncbi:hypothetical protein LINGRAHAP2_LOCUS14804 [Linum grandiflorum]
MDLVKIAAICWNAWKARNKKLVQLPKPLMKTLNSTSRRKMEMILTKIEELGRLGQTWECRIEAIKSRESRPSGGSTSHLDGLATLNFFFRFHGSLGFPYCLGFVDSLGLMEL